MGNLYTPPFHFAVKMKTTFQIPLNKTKLGSDFRGTFCAAHLPDFFPQSNRLGQFLPLTI